MSVRRCHICQYIDVIDSVIRFSVATIESAAIEPAKMRKHTSNVPEPGGPRVQVLCYPDAVGF